MIFYKKFIVMIVGMTLVGCQMSNNQTHNEINLPAAPNTKKANHSKNENFSKNKTDLLLISCDGDNAQRLQASEAVMKQIVLASTSKGQFTRSVNPYLYKAGDALHSLEIDLKSKPVTTATCREKVLTVINNLKLSAVNIN